MLNRFLSSEKKSANNSLSYESSDTQAIALAKGMKAAIERVQAVIHFNLAGEIIDANSIFLDVMGYRLDEIKGKHHRIFVDPSYANSSAYSEFWNRLRRGDFVQAEFKRFTKDGREVWLMASYNPIHDAQGNIVEVVKYATDITKQKMLELDRASQLNAISQVRAVVEFDLQGNIQKANDNFLRLMGYSFDEIRGKHHRMFIEPSEENGHEYQSFWERLRSGKPDTRVFKRIGKGGRIVWIQASYTPIVDPDGRVYKVVKFASNLTELIEQTESSQLMAQSVSTATEELTSSIGEISRNMTLSREATIQMKQLADNSGREAVHLKESMHSMERVVSFIREIAGRVNMLALNATIEAARAGEAGKGFAVVASEVKQLSDQTAKATQEIGKEIASVSEITDRVSNSIVETNNGISMVDQYVSSVATAMEEQTVVTAEIAEHTTAMMQSVEAVMKHIREQK